MFFFDKYEGQHPLNYKFEEDRIIDLTEMWDYPQLSASSAFFKRELFEKYRFPESLVNSEDTLMLNKMLLENPKYGAVTEAIYWYRRRSDESSTIDSSSTKKGFYINRLNNYFKALIDASLEKYGEVVKFIQYLITYDIQWMFSVENLSEILTNEEIKEVYLHIQDVLSYLDDDVITSLRNDKLNIRYHMLATKYAVVNVDLSGLVTYENIHSKFDGEFAGTYCGKTLVDRLDNHKIWLDIIEIRRDTLFISGFLMSFFKDSDITIEIEKNNEIFAAKRVYYRNTSKIFLGCSLESQYNFDAEIPLNKNENSKVEILVNFKDPETQKETKWRLPVDFSNYARLSQLSNYSIAKNHFLKFKDNKFYISNYNYFKMIKSEIPILLRVFKRKESYYTSILLFRLIYLILYPFFKNRRIWMFMDRRESADDNAEHLYKYAITQKDKIQKYFTVNEDSTDFKRLSDIKNLIPFYSFKHRINYLFAEKIISSHPDENILNPFYNKNDTSYAGLINSEKIFLQHGVTKDNVSSWLHKYDKNLNLITTVSDAERDSFLDEGYNYSPETIQTLGFARFDNLEKKDKLHKQIVIMPSWRENLYDMTPNYIKESEYFKNINSLINNEKLIEICKKYDFKIIFKPHPLVYEFIDLFDTNNYVTIDNDSTYQELFKNSDLLITDYSSVAFDFSYMKKPIIYYQYAKDYNFEEGYFKYKSMGFGEVIEKEDELIELIEKYLKNNCEMKELYKNRVDTFYKYNDKNNCKRIYDYILKMKY